MPEETMGGIGAVLEDELARAGAAGKSRSVILVEGESDRRALEALAIRVDRDLEAEGVLILAIAGATNFRTFLDALPSTLQLCGLYDEAEGPVLSRALDALRPSDGDLATRGFFMCRRDLEDELIRSVGTRGVLDVIEEYGEVGAWRLFCGQPAQRGRSIEARLRRFLGTKSGRKIEYAGLLAERMDLSEADSPLLQVLARTR